MRARILVIFLLSAATLAATAAEAPGSAAWTTATVAVTPGQPKGYVQFQNHCAVCHGAGTEKPGTRALRAKYGTTLPALLEERKDLAPQFVKLVVRQGVTVMPPFRKTELSDAELEAITVYLTQKKPRR